MRPVTVAAYFAASLALFAAPAAAEELTESKPSTPGHESADPVAACLDAHGRSQELRQSGLLLEAREALLECAKATCPELVSDDCLRWRDELRRQLPSVVFRVTLDGEPESKVSISLDGKQLFSEVPTKALDINPGKHTLRFVHDNFPPIEQELLIGEGEKYAVIDVAFESPSRAEPPNQGPVAAAPSALDAQRQVSTQPGERERPIPWPTYALAGVGAAGLLGFAGFGLATRSLEQDLQNSCEPDCSQSRIDRLEQRAMFADLSLAVGAAALLVAGTYYFFRPYENVEAGGMLSPSTGAEAHLRLAF